MSIFAGTEFYQPPKCDRCERLLDECDCPPIPPAAKDPAEQTARIRVEKRKKGKMVTVVRGLAEGNPEPHFSELLKKLKNHLGSGGTIVNDAMEVQGSHAERVGSFLSSLGFRVKAGQL